MTADELSCERSGLHRIIKLVAALPKTVAGRAIANQLVRVARPSLQIIALLVALALEMNSSPKWALSLKRQMKPAVAGINY